MADPVEEATHSSVDMKGSFKGKETRQFRWSYKNENFNIEMLLERRWLNILSGCLSLANYYSFYIIIVNPIAVLILVKFLTTLICEH